MRRCVVELKKDRVMELYDKYEPITRTALSLNCSPSKLRRFLIENNIPIKEYKPKAFNYNMIRTR